MCLWTKGLEYQNLSSPDHLVLNCHGPDAWEGLFLVSEVVLASYFGWVLNKQILLLPGLRPLVLRTGWALIWL